MAERDARETSPIQMTAIGLTALAGVAMLGLIASGKTSGERETAESPVRAEVAPQRVSTPTDNWSAEFAVVTPERLVSSGVLRSGDTLSDLLIGLGASPGEAHRALQPVFAAEYIDPRRVRPGVTATLTLDQPEGAPARLVGLSLRTESDYSILVSRLGEDTYTATRLDARLEPQEIRVAGEVTTSLYEAALQGGAGDQQVVDFARIFGYDIDFQREIHAGDRFEIVFESLVDERGNPVRMGEVIFASLDGRALERDFYRFAPSDDGVIDYFDSDGDSATKFLMKTPINGARLSSSFGNRRHPISGYNRLHRGTDFAAPTGTPIYAAGHGVVERASRYGGYGNYVRIQHANGYETAYAHMSRYGPGIRSGVRVRQGDVIGYVGSTGASTGPHLHYEVIVNGEHVNAMSLNFPTGRKLSETPDMMEEFVERRREIDLVRRNLGAEIEVAAAPRDPNAG